MNDDTASQISALQRQVFALLVALIVVSGTLTVYLYRQASLTGKDLATVRPQAQQIIGAYSQNKALMLSFVEQLVAYGKTHPDFVPVLMKYGIGMAPAPAKPAVAPAPAPAAPAAPKK